MNAPCAAALLVCCLAGSAAAQGYSIEAAAQAWLERPPNATTHDVEEAARVDLPFRAFYFGEPVRTLSASPFGIVAVDRSRSTELPDTPGNDAIAVWAAGVRASTMTSWIAGTESRRVLVVEWTFDAAAVAAQLLLHEERDVLVLAYRALPVTGSSVTPDVVARLDEPGGARVVEPLRGDDGKPRSTRFTPRTVLFNPPGIGNDGVPVAWQDVRKESTVPDGCTKRCTYLARGRGYFHVPDRALFRYTERGVRKQPPEMLDALREEDRRTFGGERGDATRWVRQVLDGKVLLLPADGSEPVRVWFRIVEHFSLDDRGTTLADHHTWNLRWMLSRAFPGDDPREDIDRYYAWRASARARLTVGKLFRASQTDDAGKQYDSGRKNEYVLWSGRLRHGTRGALAPLATPTDGWEKFTLMEDDMRVPQHADRDDLRFVADPHYVDGHYEYVIDALDNPFGWVTGRTVPAAPLRDEPFDTDPGREAGPITPR